MLASEIRQFSENLTALREFVEVVRPLLDDRNKQEFETNLPDLIPFVLALDAAIEGDDRPFTSEQREELEKRFDGTVEVNVEERSESGAKVQIRVEGSSQKQFRDAMQKIGATSYHSELLYRNALISLVSAAEWFLSQILHAHFEKHPESAGLNEKTLSFRDLQQLGAIEEAQEYLLDLKTEDILRGSFDDWIQYLKNHLKLSASYIDESHDDLVEICQRRNLMVHNGGFVNRTYQTKVAEDKQGRAPQDAPLLVPKSYLEASIDLFERSFILIAAELWKKIEPENPQRSVLLNDLAFRHLIAERWEVAKSLSKFVIGDRRLPERDRLIGEINYWQSRKWTGEFDDIKQDVESADYSAKEPIYRLAQLALLDQDDKFFELLPTVLENGSLTLGDVRTWPLFREMRKNQLYTDRYSEDRSPEEENDSPLPN